MASRRRIKLSSILDPTWEAEVMPLAPEALKKLHQEYIRIRGVNVIHGGENSLRFTPHFRMTSEEVDLLVDATREALLKGPVKAAASAAAAA